MPRTCPECQVAWEDDVDHCPEDGTDLSEIVDDDPLIGRSIGSYRVLKLLGKGGMGSVYLAQHPVIGSRVAIKFLHPQFSKNKKIVDRFFNEARAVNVIGHDNILKILDLSVTEDGIHYFVMEFLQGKPVQELVGDGNTVTLEVAGPILLQFCEALQAAHDRKIYHRDIKPENVYLITHKGRKNFVKVVDFGVAKLTDGAGGVGTGATQTGLVVGTPAYMSPEQAGGLNKNIDARSDVYSAGVLMFQLATGQLPFPSPHFGEVLIGHLQLAPPRPRDLNPEVPEAWERIILQALEKKQEARQQSMRELSAQLAETMGALGISAELPLADAAELSASGQHAPFKMPAPGTPLPVLRKKTELPRFGEAKVVARPNAPKKKSGMTLATRMAAPETMSTRPPPLAPKNNRPLLLAVAGGLAVLFVVIGLLFWTGADSSEQIAQTRAHKAAAAARLAAEDAVDRSRKEAEKTGPVLLSVVSDPLGAEVEASWRDGGLKRGSTPLDFRVPRNTKVSFQFKLRGYLPYRVDIIADEAQVVKAELPRDAPRVGARKGPPAGAHSPAKSPVSGDDVIEVGDDIFK